MLGVGIQRFWGLNGFKGWVQGLGFRVDLGFRVSGLGLGLA